MRTLAAYFGWNSERIPYNIEELAYYAQQEVMLLKNFNNAIEWIKKDLVEELIRQQKPCAHAGCYNHISHLCEGCGRIQGKIPQQTLNEITKILDGIK